MFNIGDAYILNNGPIPKFLCNVYLFFSQITKAKLIAFLFHQINIL